MFTRRHERELAEIKELTQELDQRFQDVLDQLERIKENQRRLAAQDQPGENPRDRRPSPVVVGRGAKSGKRERVTMGGSSDDAPEGEAARKRRPRKGRASGRDG
jgi:hypothetical protein